MKTMKFTIYLVLVILCLFNKAAFAIPAFQVYIQGADAGTIGQDEDTWFTGNSSFDLVVAGAYGPGTINLAEVTLVVSVLKNETGTISLTSGGSGAGNLDSYDSYGNKDFLPEGFNSNNHYPFKEDVSNFMLYSMGDFENIPDAVSHYSTQGPIKRNVADGEEKWFRVDISGYTYVHFDVYGQIAKHNGKASWRMAPGSADAAYVVPEPVSLLLLGLGGFMIRRRNRSYSSKGNAAH